MKILFVNPHIYDFSAFDLWLRPLGLSYLAGAVKEYTNSDIYWLDVLDRAKHQKNYIFKREGRGKYERVEVQKPDIYRGIPRKYSRYGMSLDNFHGKLNELPSDIDLVFITTLMTYWIDGVNFTLNELKKKFKKAKFFIGGVLPTLLRNEIKRYISADGFIFGYGESEVLNIIEEYGGRVKKEKFDNLDDIPFPEFEYFGEKKVLPLLTSRGCPFNCTYCASRLLNKSFKERKPEAVFDEIKFHYEKYGTEHFVIFDDAFLINKKKRFFEIFNRVRREIPVKFHTPNGIHAREIDEETAVVLFESGFKTIRLSFESIDKDILEQSKNKVNAEEMVRAVENLLKAGYKYGDIEAYLLFGMYKQNLKSLYKSLDFVRDLRVIPRLSYFSPVPGTVDFIKLQKKAVLSQTINLYETNKTYFTYYKSGLLHEQIKEVNNYISRFKKNY